MAERRAIFRQTPLSRSSIYNLPPQIHSLHLVGQFDSVHNEPLFAITRSRSTDPADFVPTIYENYLLGMNSIEMYLKHSQNFLDDSVQIIVLVIMSTIRSLTTCILALPHCPRLAMGTSLPLIRWYM